MNQVIYVDRKDTNSKKWDCQSPMFGEENLHPMWVADMDFKVPDCVTKAIKSYLDIGVLGYYNIPDTYYEAFINWQKYYHNSIVLKDWIRFAPGVVPAVNWIIQFLTQSHESVIVLTPVYYPFLDAIKNNKRTLIACDLINRQGRYTIDFDEFEKQIVDNDVKLFILCSPHNPVGRVWTVEELNNLLLICKKHNVFVVSDEIHQDFVFLDNSHTPTLNISGYSEIVITLTAASKTFNLAGCQNSFVVIPNKELRKKYDEFISNIRVLNGNSLGYVAVEAAYSHGRAWFEELKQVIYENYLYITSNFKEYLPNIVISPLEGTYLLWLDFEYYLKAEEMSNFMQQECKLALDYGEWFGGKNFGTYVRMNIATSKESVEIAVKKIINKLN